MKHCFFLDKKRGQTEKPFARILSFDDDHRRYTIKCLFTVEGT